MASFITNKLRYSNKDRLYLVLKPHNKSDLSAAVTNPADLDAVHWCIGISPKNENVRVPEGTLYYLANRDSKPEHGNETRFMEQQDFAFVTSPNQVAYVRILLGKIKDTRACAEAIKGVAPRAGCKIWAKEVLYVLNRPASPMATCVDMDFWDQIQDDAKTVVGEKRDKGRYSAAKRAVPTVMPTFDAMAKRELNP